MADSNDLSRVESYQFPHAHIGHLSPAQQDALERFKQLCVQKGYYQPAGTAGRTVASHDDETMLYVHSSNSAPN